jgi:hypothetical protein
MANTTIHEINLKPDFKAIFDQFDREARLKADTVLADLPEPDEIEQIKPYQLGVLRAMQGILAPVNICAQAVDSGEAVQRLRNLIDALVTTIRAKADEIESAIEHEGDICDQCGSRIRNGVQRANGAYCSEECADVNEPTEPQEPEEGDWVTEDYFTWRRYEGSRNDVMVLENGEQDWRVALKQRMDADRFWPNVWCLSDHGNWHLLDREAE